MDGQIWEKIGDQELHVFVINCENERRARDEASIVAFLASTLQFASLGPSCWADLTGSQKWHVLRFDERH
jgi:hypothetical protein